MQNGAARLRIAKKTVFLFIICFVTFAIIRHISFLLRREAKKLTGLTGGGADAERTLDRFADAGDVAEWTKASVAAAVEQGLIQGRGELLAPGGELTRAEAAAIVQRLLKQSGLID